MTSWPQNAYVGQKVVRLNKEFHPLDPTKPNETYTIKLIGLFLNQYIYFTLNEASCPFGNMGWLYVLFRPVQSTDTGMAILKELLINPHEVLEDA